MSSVALVFDYDLTCTEELQQMPLIRKYINNYKEYYKGSRGDEILEYEEKFTRFEDPFDFFRVIDARRKKVQQKHKNARLQNGVTWMRQLCIDMQPEHPLENVTDEELREIGKEVKLSPGIKECFKKLKEDWGKDGIDIKIYVVSVGLKSLIEGALEDCVDCIYAGEIYDKEIYYVIEDYSKTEVAFEIAKGGKGNRDLKLRGADYIIPYSKFVVVGDGFSDIPSWRFYRKHGAKCVMVYEADNLKSYEKAMSIAWREANFVLERFYVPDNRNPTWKYINDAIKEVVYKKCEHSEYSIHRYRWSKIASKSEEREIETHLKKCKEHESGINLIHVVPKDKSWYSK